ncbi:MAG: hypothetical protein ABIQ30_12360 [Devosia sp.]
MTNLEFAIFGSNLLSSLLAGLLTRDHGKRVARIGRRRSTQRLPRGLDLALPLSARAETWKILRNGERETATLLAAIGAEGSLSMGEVALFADTAASTMALDHVSHLAVGFDHQMARLKDGWAMRRVAQISAEMADDAITKWLRDLGVVLADEGPVEAELMVIADDAALLEQIAPEARPPMLRTEAMMSTLIVSTRGLARPVERYLDRGVTLMRRPGSTILALVAGEHDVDARLASTLGGPFPMKRLATTHYRRVVTTDGAPLLGGVSGTFAIAGLGTGAPFFAPVLARHLAGKASAEEASWVNAHGPETPRDIVSDIAEVLL